MDLTEDEYVGSAARWSEEDAEEELTRDWEKNLMHVRQREGATWVSMDDMGEVKFLKIYKDRFRLGLYGIIKVVGGIAKDAFLSNNWHKENFPDQEVYECHLFGHGTKHASNLPDLWALVTVNISKAWSRKKESFANGLSRKIMTVVERAHKLGHCCEVRGHKERLPRDQQSAHCQVFLTEDITCSTYRALRQPLPPQSS